MLFRSLEGVLTAHGMAVVRGAIDREARLAKIEDNPDFRDPGKYYLALFGQPGAGVWGFRFEGHHLSLNLTFEGDLITSLTPFLLGANPKDLPEGTPDPMAGFLAAHDDPQAFLQEFRRMFLDGSANRLLGGANVETGGFGLWGHPHMEVSGPNDFGKTQ